MHTRLDYKERIALKYLTLHNIKSISQKQPAALLYLFIIHHLRVVVIANKWHEIIYSIELVEQTLQMHKNTRILYDLVLDCVSSLGYIAYIYIGTVGKICEFNSTYLYNYR